MPLSRMHFLVLSLVERFHVVWSAEYSTSRSSLICVSPCDDQYDSSHGLSSGAIAAIVVSSVAVPIVILVISATIVITVCSCCTTLFENDVPLPGNNNRNYAVAYVV